MFGEKSIILMYYILYGAILLSFVQASPISFVSKQVGLSEDVQVLRVNGSEDCRYGGKIYQNGDHFKDPLSPCDVCHCSGGDVICSVINCPPAPSAGCKEEQEEEGKCCPSYVCPTVSDDQIKTESILTDTTTPSIVSEIPQRTEDPALVMEQNVVNSLFIHKVILESIMKEQEEERLNEVDTTELPVSNTEVFESMETSTVSENYDEDLESISEKDTTEELLVEGNLIREASETFTIKSDITTTFDPTERSVEEETEAEKSVVTENSALNKVVSTTISDVLEQKETTDIEYETNISTTEKQLSEISEESTPIYAFRSDRTEEPVEEATEVPITENEEAEASVPETENLIKAAESIITSQTEVYEEENSTSERSILETTRYYEEKDVSTSDYTYVTNIPEQTTNVESLELRSLENDETFDHVSTISNNEISDESVSETSTISGTEISMDIITVRNADHKYSSELSDEILTTTSEYNKSDQREEDTDLLYTFEGDSVDQASKTQKSEFVDVEENNKNEKDVEGTTLETETLTNNNMDVTDSPYYEETTTTLVEGDAITEAMEETEIGNLFKSDVTEVEMETTTVAGEEIDMESLFKSDITEDSLSDFDSSTDAASEHLTTEIYSTTVFSEDTETVATDIENARKESIDETTTTSETVNDDTEYILVEESTTQGGTTDLLDEELISTTENSEASGDTLETTDIPFVRQESKILLKTLSSKKENKIEPVIETKLENTTDKSNETSTESKVKSQEKTTETDLKIKRKPQESSIHMFDKILSNGSVTRIETHSSEDRKRPKTDRISTQFHHLARKYGLRPLTRKTFREDVKNRRKSRLNIRKSLSQNAQ